MVKLDPNVGHKGGGRSRKQNHFNKNSQTLETKELQERWAIKLQKLVTTKAETRTKEKEETNGRINSCNVTDNLTMGRFYIH